MTSLATVSIVVPTLNEASRIEPCLRRLRSDFPGCELVVEPRRKLVLVLLTNRAHPNWSWANPDPTRVAVANVIADSQS